MNRRNWYKVTVPIKISYTEYRNLKKWCYNNIKGNWTSSRQYTPHFSFEQQADAVAFILHCV